MSEVVDRRAGRVLVVNAAGRVLLIEAFDPRGVPGESYWFTPGGGLNPGESTAEGAARELREETGLVVGPAALRGPVWHEVSEFRLDGIDYRQDQDFYLLRVESWEVEPAALDDFEQATITGFRWWSLAELDQTTADVWPKGLADLLRANGVS